MNRVIELYVQSFTETEIAKQTKLKRTYVLELIKDFKKSSVASHEMNERAVEAINVMDKHFDRLIKQAWKTLNQIDEQIQTVGFSTALLKERTSAIKAIASLETDRIATMQKAGMLDSASMGEEMARLEEQRDVILEILRNDLCDKCRPNVMSKLAEITNQVAPVVVYSE